MLARIDSRIKILEIEFSFKEEELHNFSNKSIIFLDRRILQIIIQLDKGAKDQIKDFSNSNTIRPI